MLKWEDVLWDQKVIMVSSPKTERHRGKAVRKIPLFPHIEECLTAAFEQAEVGAVYVVEKHAPLYLRGKKERTYIGGQGNLGTVFAKIIRRAGIVPWKKLIHNLRASFETDLLNGKHGKFGLHTIAGWLGHSVKVMLEHYGRIQQSDYDQIEQACLRIKREKDQMMSDKEAHLVPFSSCKEGFDTEYTAPTPPGKAAQNAAQHTAVEGGIEGNGAEMPPSTNTLQPLTGTVFSSKKRHREESHGIPHCTPVWAIIGGGGNRHCCCNSLHHKELEQSSKPSGAKCGALNHYPENEQLSDVISAWSLLPPDTRQAILLLVRQYVQ